MADIQRLGVGTSSVEVFFCLHVLEHVRDGSSGHFRDASHSETGGGVRIYYGTLRHDTS